MTYKEAREIFQNYISCELKNADCTKLCQVCSYYVNNDEFFQAIYVAIKGMEQLARSHKKKE